MLKLITTARTSCARMRIKNAWVRLLSAALLAAGSMGLVAWEIQQALAKYSLGRPEGDQYSGQVGQFRTGDHWRLPEGTLVPDFTLPGLLDRKPLTLADLRKDKPVILILSSFT